MHLEISDMNNQERALAHLHEHLWQYLDSILRKYNPCGWKDGKCQNTTLPSPMFCCKNCNTELVRTQVKGMLIGNHWSETGCTIHSLGCKMFLCGCQSNIPPKALKRWNKACGIAVKYNISTCYMSFEETLQYLRNRSNKIHLA